MLGHSRQGDNPNRKRSFLHPSREKKDKTVVLFQDLYEQNETIDEEFLHWAIRDVGLKIREGKITGSNSRNTAILQAIRQVILDHQGQGSRIKGELNIKIGQIQEFLYACRRLNFGLDTALQTLKSRIGKIPTSWDIEMVKSFLCDSITDFIQMKIQYPISIIAQTVRLMQAADIIQNGEIILTFARSSAVEATLLKAKEMGKEFSVIVADSRPNFEARKMLKVLLDAQIPCTYTLLSSVSYHMHEVTRVFLGSSGITTNGYIVNRAGTGMLCSIAHRFKKPVLVCVESYKFSERVQIDSICSNELGDVKQLINTQMYSGDTRISPMLTDWMDDPHLLLLDLKYDYTPSLYIGMVITEVGCLPVTSIPVILREYDKELKNEDLEQEIKKMNSMKSEL